MTPNLIDIRRSVAGAAGAAALGFGLTIGGAATAQPLAAPAQLENGAPYSFADLIEQVSPAVVSINVTLETDREAAGPFTLPVPREDLPDGFEEFFRQFSPDIDPEDLPERMSQGSGFFISPDGYVVTNNHVVDGAQTVTVRLEDDEEFSAEIIGTDELTDLAVLKVSRDAPFPYVSFDEEDSVRVGDWVIAMGNPFGLSGTATAGIISANGRQISSSAYYEFLQIDAPINRGNSGGPTFDLQGRVVGVNSQIYSPSGGSVGIGFAIPSSAASHIVNAIIEDGRVVRGWLGVGIDEVDEDVAASLGLDHARGAIVSDVHANGPAEAAGFELQDIILEVDGHQVEDRTDLVRRVGALLVGERVRFTVFRDGRERELVATIGDRPSVDELASRTAGGSSSDPDLRPSSSSLGMSLSSLDEDALLNLGDGEEGGVLVDRVNARSEAARKGIGPGTIILRVGGEAVTSPAQFEALIRDARSDGEEAVLMLVQINNNRHYVALPLESED